MDIVEIAKKQWKDKIGDKRRSYEVQEWKDEEGKPAVIYYNPITVGARIEIQKLLSRNSTEMEKTIAILQVICLREDGTRIWNKVSTEDMKQNYDSIILTKIQLDILSDLSDLDKQIESAKKD